MHILKDIIANPAPAPATVQSVQSGMISKDQICNGYREILQAKHDAEAHYNHLSEVLNATTVSAVCGQIAFRSRQLHVDAIYDLLGALALAHALEDDRPAMLENLKAHIVTPITAKAAAFWEMYGAILSQYGFTETGEAVRKQHWGHSSR